MTAMKEDGMKRDSNTEEMGDTQEVVEKDTIKRLPPFGNGIRATTSLPRRGLGARPIFSVTPPGISVFDSDR